MVPPGSGLLLGRVPGVRHGGPPHLYGTSNDGLPHLGVSHVLLLQLQLRPHGGDDLGLLDSLVHLQVEFN